MANIQQRKGTDGSTKYRVQVRLQGFPPQSATFERKTDAKIWASQTEAAIREGRYFPSNDSRRHTVAALVDRFLEGLEHRKPHAYAKQKQLLGWWKERLGPYALANVTPALIAQRRDELLAENIGTEESPRHRSPATANRYLAALSKAFSDAVREWHWLNENPLRRVSKESESQGRVRYLSDEERTTLLDQVRKSKQKGLYAVVLLALTTGMRRGEILALRWPDIDLKRGIAVLHKTKNQERRSVPIVPEVAKLLEEIGRVRHLDTDLVFSRDGEAITIEIDHSFREALKAAGIENFRFHDLRHTAASYLAMSGATSAEIAAVLGHKTLQMVKRYSHLSDAHTGGVIERMTKKFFGNGSP